jgi:hypothetical protein
MKIVVDNTTPNGEKVRLVMSLPEMDNRQLCDAKFQSRLKELGQMEFPGVAVYITRPPSSIDITKPVRESLVCQILLRALAKPGFPTNPKIDDLDGDWLPSPEKDYIIESFGIRNLKGSKVAEDLRLYKQIIKIAIDNFYQTGRLRKKILSSV